MVGEAAKGCAGALGCLVGVAMGAAWALDLLPQVRAGALALEAAAAVCALRSPELAALCLPMAVLIGVLLALGGLRRTGQLSALEAAGISPLSPLLPLCLGAMAAALGGYALADVVAPTCRVASLRVLHTNTPAACTSAAKGGTPGPGVYYPETGTGRFLAARSSDGCTGALRDVVYHCADARGRGRHTVTLAASAVWQEEESRWAFRSGATYRLDTSKDADGEMLEGWEAFKEAPEPFQVDSIGRGPRDLAVALGVPGVEAQPHELSQVFDAMPVARADAAADLLAGTTRRSEAAALRLKARQRQAVQLAAPVLAGLALVLSASSPITLRHSENLALVVQGLALVFLYYLASLLGTLALALGALPWPWLAAHLPNLLGVSALVLGCVYPRRRNR